MGRDGHAESCIARPLMRSAEARRRSAADKVPQLLHLFSVNFSEKLVLGHKNQKKRRKHLICDQNANICTNIVAAAEENAAEKLDAVWHSQPAAKLKKIWQTCPRGIELRGGNAEGVENADGSWRQRSKRELAERYGDAKRGDDQPR